ncbi:amino acid adenylation domain-containing protein [Actinospica durhamensis]|uniref:Amino acid adenylation domain-containing protein n=1 Tax=Actinospica durhamensis TaxID=1508375 RepID=A0A941EJW0_9ACTN|nr:non-ribosomal peptide synthetase [Actinospica durhamensis]MBR7832551.1 amino acid adenylation domain-containing protein [Actinospica durhamensis]
MAELLDEAFLARARATPEAIALSWPGGSMAYGALEQATAKLAGRLRAAGVGPETVVGLSAARGPGLILGMVAILRSGGAWLPLDPEYPADRLAYMIADSGLSVLLADATLSAPVPASALRIDLDAALSEPDDVPDDVLDGPLPAAQPGDLAYLIYTSGTTGRPKGVLVEHGGVANSVRAMRLAWGITEQDRVIQFSSASFDASVCEIWTALTAGATLVLRDRLSLLPGPGLVDVLRQEQVSVAVVPPSVMAALPEDTQLPDLRTLVLQGEALTAQIAARWGAGRTLFNGYGPTEASICASSARIEPGLPVTIGRPIDGAALRVVDTELAPVPAGTVGELLIGGAGVARGYHNVPALTAERFVVLEDGERVYRTGDMARELPDGTYEFVGRHDGQVKLRGIRIEVEEIAAVLRSHPRVRDAAVVLRQERLVGYAVTAASAAELLGWCAERLPNQLVPSAIVPIEAFPLSPNGKLDRDALPEPDRVHAGLAAAGTAARTDAEAAVIEIVRELLGAIPVGVEDDFFALGGHSLSVGRLAARLRTRLGADVPLAKLYADSTIAAIAASAEAAAAEAGSAGDAPNTPPVPPPVAVADRAAPLPLTFPQDRVWYLDQLWPGNSAYHANASLKLRGALDVNALERALSEIVRRHEVFRSRFTEVDGRPVQVPVDAMPIELPVIDLTDFDPAEQHARSRAVIERELRRPFRLDEPPLARWTLIRRGPQEHELVHIEHHLVHDGWSFAVFVEELAALYPAYASGSEPSLPPVTLQIGDVAAWQREWLQGPVLDRYLDHWTTAMHAAPLLQLPLEEPRPPEFSFEGAALKFALPAAECAAIRAGARAHKATLFSVMLAGFAALVSRYADQDDFVVGTTAANRRDQEAERVVGMLVNTLPLRIDLTGDPAFGELVERVQAVVADGLAWQDIPLQYLIKELMLERDLSYNPLFSTMFSFHDSAVPDLEFGGLTGEFEIQHNGSAKADLNIVVMPRAEQRLGRPRREEDQDIKVVWEYATDLFTAESMGRMAAAYRELLLAGLAQPTLPLSHLPIGATGAIGAVAAEPESEHASVPTLADQFAEQVRRVPDHAAIIADHTMTYQELDEAARALVERVQRGETTLKAIRAAIPDRGCALFVAELAATQIDATPHRELAAICTELKRREFASGAVAQLAPPQSPLFALELWSALTSGSPLHVIEAHLKDPAATSHRLRTHEIAHVILPSRLADALAAALAAGGSEALAATQTALIVGPHPTPRTVAVLQDACARVLVGFGTDSVPLLVCDEPERVKPGTLQLRGGHPIPGLAVEVRDRAGRPQPPGVPGLLHAANGSEHGDETWRALRRSDGTIQILGAGARWPEVNGFRVSPHQLAAALAEYPPVARAQARFLDGVVLAQVVLREGAELGDPMRLRMFLADRLPMYQMPDVANISVVEDLPPDEE